MTTFRKIILLLLTIAIVLGLASCGSTDISDGVYAKSKKYEFPYVIVKGENFNVYQDFDRLYRFSSSPNSDGEYIYDINEFVSIVISRKSKDSIKVDIRKRADSVAAAIDIIAYKNMKGTYTLE